MVIKNLTVIEINAALMNIQKQIEALRKSNAEADSKITALNSQLTALTARVTALEKGE